jgi:hypothetical protein
LTYQAILSQEILSRRHRHAIVAAHSGHAVFVANNYRSNQMKTRKAKMILIALAATVGGSAALARPPIQLPFLPPPPPSNHCFGRQCTSAPEIDPGSAMGGLALLAGTIAIVRGRRGKK